MKALSYKFVNQKLMKSAFSVQENSLEISLFYAAWFWGRLRSTLRKLMSVFLANTHFFLIEVLQVNQVGGVSAHCLLIDDFWVE